MSVRATDLDVAALPDLSVGHRDNLWWGVAGLLAIEGTVFAILVATYLYLLHVAAHTGVTLHWPPSGTPPPGLGWSTATLAVLLVSAVPMRSARRACARFDRAAVLRGLSLGTVAGVVAVALRALEFTALGARWDAHAYGSIVWTVLGMHAAHLVTSAVENVLLILLLVRGPIQAKHFVDVEVTAVYWYFVVASWVPLYALVYLLPRLTS